MVLCNVQLVTLGSNLILVYFTLSSAVFSGALLTSEWCSNVDKCIIKSVGLCELLGWHRRRVDVKSHFHQTLWSTPSQREDVNHSDYMDFVIHTHACVKQHTVMCTETHTHEGKKKKPLIHAVVVHIDRAGDIFHTRSGQVLWWHIYLGNLEVTQ